MEHPLSQFKYCPKCGSAHFEVHNEKSKQCADCGFVYYFNPSSATVALILNADLYFIDKIGLKEHLSPTRSNGLLSMVKQMRMYALAFKAKDI